MMLTRAALEAVLDRAPQLTIGLLGDLFLDRYLEISPTLSEISIETGLEAYQVQRVRNVAGALGTVMNNLAALGVGRIVPISVIGDDGPGHDLLRVCRAMRQVDSRTILQCEERLTPTYTKPIKRREDGTWQEFHRLDIRTRGPLAEATTQRVRESLRGVFRVVDGLIVLDQVPETDWGVVNVSVRNALEQLSSRQREKLVFIDSRNHLGHFKRGVLKGNQHELATAVGYPDESEQVAGEAAKRLASQTGSPVFCTMGEQGILVAPPAGNPTIVPSFPVQGPIDIVGAGDSATAGMVVSLLAGANHEQAAAVANLVASITVQQIGTTGTATPEQVLQRWREAHDDNGDPGHAGA